MTQSVYTRKYSKTGIIIAVLIILAAVLAGWWAFRHAQHNPMSEEGVLEANTVQVASTVGGRIQEIYVQNEQRVQKGEPLFALDPVPFQLAVAQASADLQMAEAALNTQQRSIGAEKSNAAVAAEQIIRAKNNLALAEANLQRLRGLAPKGYISAQELDTATTAKKDAQTSLIQAEHQSTAATTLVSNLNGSEALVASRKAALALAERALAQSRVYAPHNGLVDGLHVASGSILAPGQPLFTLIDTQHWYAVATFPETELSHIHVGDCAKVYVTSNNQHPVYGQVQGIGWGVRSQDKINLGSGLPIIPKSLKWIRLEQRFPVRILLHQPPENTMRIGATIVAVIHQSKSCDFQ